MQLDMQILESKFFLATFLDPRVLVFLRWNRRLKAIQNCVDYHVINALYCVVISIYDVVTSSPIYEVLSINGAIVLLYGVLPSIYGVCLSIQMYDVVTSIYGV